MGLKLSDKKPEKKTMAPIRKRSKKMEKQMVVYRKIVAEMMNESDRCQLCTPNCIGIASGLHHQKKRIGFLLDKRYLKRACSPCQTWTELFPLEAIKLELSLSKFSK